MTSITIGGVECDIPQFKLREIKAAAPYIDRVLAERRKMSARAGETAEQATERLVDEEEDILVRMTGSLTDTISVIAVGVLKGRQAYPYTPARIAETAEEIEAELSMDEVNRLGPVFDSILREAGMVRAAPSPMMTGRGTGSELQSGSTASSPSSSQPGAPAATGTE